MHDINDLEQRGVPAIFVASSEFREAAQAQAVALGIEPAVVFVPHPIQDRTDAEMRTLADQTLEEILQALTADPT